MRIVRLVGAVWPTDLQKIFETCSGATLPRFLHIDLVDAVIPDLSTMRAFERAVDRLERHEIDVRIVGLDPLHPALFP